MGSTQSTWEWIAAHPVAHSSHTSVTMVVPDVVKEKVGELPDIAGMSKDDLSALVKQLYDQSCAVFGEKFHMEYAVKKRDMEIHNLEMETSESHGTFKIPKLKKVNKLAPSGTSRKPTRIPIAEHSHWEKILKLNSEI